jgi:hypothetical protein
MVMTRKINIRKFKGGERVTDTKYGKYITTDLKKKFMRQWSSVRKVSTYVDAKVVEGGYYLMGTWWYKASKIPHPSKAHVHEDWDEYLGFIGTNPNDPLDLGGEVELWLGGEKHMLTKTCTVFVPAGLEHCPVYFRRVDSPIWFLATGPNKKYTLKKKE